MTMTKRMLDDILAQHGLWLRDAEGGAKADLHKADLREANLREVDLSWADLHEADLSDAGLWGANLLGANLRRANLNGADLRGAVFHMANLYGADLRGANLCWADLRGADLRDADLNGADLHGADLREANLDYASWPLWCNSLSPRIDKRLAAQLLYHALRAMQSCGEDPDVAAVLASEANLRLANQFHRAAECGEMEPPEGAGEGGAE